MWCWGCPYPPHHPLFLLFPPHPRSCQEAERKPWVSYSPTRFYSNLYSAQVSRERWGTP